MVDDTYDESGEQNQFFRDMNDNGYMLGLALMTRLLARMDLS